MHENNSLEVLDECTSLELMIGMDVMIQRRNGSLHNATISRIDADSNTPQG